MAEVLFRRVLSNLLTNAFRFTPPGGAVSLAVSSTADRLLLEVADTGIGISDEEQNMIFEEFYRGGNIEGRRGLGLGLSIVNEAVQLMNGSITVTSAAGVGSRFKVELPISNDTDPAELRA
jgi:signal transduction histidine kinase